MSSKTSGSTQPPGPRRARVVASAGSPAAPALPTGTVTFLFTDIEGSTRLLRELGDSYAPLLADHHRLLREAFTDHSGVVVGTEGDAVFASFEQATQAVAGALRAQLAVAERDWGRQPLRVRMGIHTGEAQLADGDYVGLAVHEAARICSAAHGGQVLVSQRTKDLTTSLPDDAELLDLGEHRLKDITDPIRLFELTHPKTEPRMYARANAVLPNNLPAELTTFIGREAQLRDVRGLLERTRLLTITGAGGSGKTRLALQTAQTTLEQYRDGCWFVDLAAIADGTLVWNAWARAFGLREQPDRSVQDLVLDRLRDRSALVVVDNCEHMIEDALAVCRTVLIACPGVRLIATSREPLTIEGETVWRAPSLGVPAEAEPQEAIEQSEAVRLFLERAEHVRPGFSLTPDNATSVAEICRRLDGMPLAVELAAARVRAHTPQEIAKLLDRRFTLLTGGARSGLRRQQTLRAAIDWSYDLLTEAERLLFRRLSVFVDGFTLDAAEGICAGGPIDHADVLDLLDGLVDRSLVVAEPITDQTRYRLLESTREYARDLLASSSEAPELWSRHLEWHAQLAEWAREEVEGGPDQLAWGARFESELGNVRQALSWAITEGDASAGVRLAAALRKYWDQAGHLAEGRAWLEQLLASETVEPVSHVEGSIALAWLMLRSQHQVEAKRILEGLAANDLERSGDRSIGDALQLRGRAIQYVDFDWAEATRLLTTAVEVYERAGYDLGYGRALASLADATFQSGDVASASALYARAIDVHRRGRHFNDLILCLTARADLELADGRRDHAKALQDEAITLGRHWASDLEKLYLLTYRGEFAIEEGDFREAERLLRQAVEGCRQRGEIHGEGHALAALSEVLSCMGLYDEARTICATLRDRTTPTGSGVSYLSYIGNAELIAGDLDEARRAYEKMLLIAAGMKDDWLVAACRSRIALVDLVEGDVEKSAGPIELAVESSRRRGRDQFLGHLLLQLGLLRMRQGLVDDAGLSYHEALELLKDRYFTPIDLVTALERIGQLELRWGRSEHACRLLGAAATQRDRMRTPAPRWQADLIVDPALRQARESLSDEAFRAAIDAGRAMSLDEAIALALEGLSGVNGGR